MENKNARKSGGKISVGRVIKGFFATIGRFIATCVMVGVITGCIVACVMTVYVLNYIGADDELDLDTVELGYTSTMLYYDKNTQSYQELRKLYIPDNNRIWVNLDEISDYAKQAVIATEDKRFMEHQGVDYRRTFGAFLSQFIPGASKGGGSTITQQLIKNVTGDDDLRIDRKVREIFRALQLEKNYSKERILEAYLNVVPFGSGTNGIEMASLTYFGKNASELSLAEAASIIGITQYPTYYNPFINPENNKERQGDVLHFMYEQDRITKADYDAALKEPLVFKREEYQQQSEEIMNYYEDYVFESVVQDLMDQYNWTRTHATDMIYRSGWTIYTCVDLEIQEYLENFYLTTEKFPTVTNTEYPQSAANIIEPSGKLVATVGGLYEKTGSRVWSRATDSTRHPGSSIKPIGAYALSFEYNRINWSTIMVDGPINTAEPGKPAKMWPTNYYNAYYGNVTVARAVQESINTIPVKLVESLTPRVVFDFLHDQLGMTNLVDRMVIDGKEVTDVVLAPMALGALTKGVSNLEMAGAYQMFANGGTFTTPYCYTKVEDSNGRVILEKGTDRQYVISEDTSVVMNKLLQTVTTESNGTGTRARLDNMPTAGKTGTSDDDVNQWFIGMSPYYICAVWLGYDSETRVNEYGNIVPNTIYYRGVPYPPPILWKSIMQPLHEGLDYIQFPESENVVSHQYCTITGKLASTGCPVATGWYKKTGTPSHCTGHPTTSGSSEDGEDGGGRSGTTGNAADSANPDDGHTQPLRVLDDDLND